MSEDLEATIKLGGSCSLSGIEIDFAVFFGEYLTSRTWCLLRVAEPCVVFESVAKQSNKSYKETAIGQKLALMLGTRSMNEKLFAETMDENDAKADFVTEFLPHILGKVKQRTENFYKKQESEAPNDSAGKGSYASGSSEQFP